MSKSPEELRGMFYFMRHPKPSVKRDPYSVARSLNVRGKHLQARGNYGVEIRRPASLRSDSVADKRKRLEDWRTIYELALENGDKPTADAALNQIWEAQKAGGSLRTRWNPDTHQWIKTEGSARMMKHVGLTHSFFDPKDASLYAHAEDVFYDSKTDSYFRANGKPYKGPIEFGEFSKGDYKDVEPKGSLRPKIPGKDASEVAENRQLILGVVSNLEKIDRGENVPHILFYEKQGYVRPVYKTVKALDTGRDITVFDKFVLTDRARRALNVVRGSIGSERIIDGKSDIAPFLKYKPHSRVVKSVGYQTGRFGNIERDAQLHAKLPGKRRTEWGSDYWETRRNRSDMKGLPI